MDKYPIQSNSTLSPWFGDLPEKVRKFFPGAGKSAFHGLYSQGMDRFFLVDNVDVWSALHAAKLLSSKLPLFIYILNDDKQRITTLNCLSWTVANKNIPIAVTQPPILKILNSPSEIVDCGFPPMNEEETQALLSEQEFGFFVMRATYAMRLTDASLNRSNHDYYTPLFPEIGSRIEFKQTPDETGWPSGFVTAVERILYHSTEIQQALDALNKLLASSAVRRSRAVAQYGEMFFDLLGNEAVHA
jgi:hypothetical protein